MKNRSSMQSIIMVAFAAMSVSIILIMGIVMYIRWYQSAMQENIRGTQSLMEQTIGSLENYLHKMRQISDTAYYNIIKENRTEDTKMQENLNLLYETNKDGVRSIALFTRAGSLLVAEPVADEKEGSDVTLQNWFIDALSKVENMHFSTPHIQSIFDDGTGKLYQVITLSRAVDITSNERVSRGVLLVDMDYSGVSDILEQVNLISSGAYFYLCDKDGEIIYHPRQSQIEGGVFVEESLNYIFNEDESLNIESGGDKKTVIMDSVGYTGWKLVSVISHDSPLNVTGNMFYFISMLIALMVMATLIISQIVSNRISNPLRKLDESVLEYEAGKKPEFYFGGTIEIRHLGESIKRYYEQIEILMERFAKEQNERRKSELEALQSQINPHFLYNTLDSITWMIESEKNEEAIFMISQLARLFRISLSKGKTIISLGSEFLHAQSYMNIQKLRYKDAFTVLYDIPGELENYCIVKLVLQPLLENAINYGIEGADEARITVSAKKEGEDLYISVSDNGNGMTKEEAALILTDSNRIQKKGSGVGLVNVNNRIKILFGEEYGLNIESEPDEGTRVTIHIPAIEYTMENCRILEGEDEKD